ncbi:pilus assembly protein [Roseomonas sp. SSH11]|uniref:Pilus assembly protein n=1 Tax=Pararoseomonas baculiformis TaxID=2820812 RepID=A0ABS4AE50_9PROT|nr:TadE/TadG family type IV pilus assembly protein [Pararoseomonas baculiformis]MBP0445294.1 pilus assembly protein [Pararoseomonas baculiformis]
MRLPRIGRRGIAASELAVIAPLLLVLLAGVHDVANRIQVSLQLESAVQTGAQQALATPGNLTAIRNAVIAASPGLTTAEVPMPRLTCECAGAASTCGSSCPSGESRYITLTAQRNLTPLLISSLSSGSGHAVVQIR